MTETFDLAPAAQQMQRLVAGVRDDQLDAPTPCDSTTVGALLDHIVGLSVAFRAAADKEDLPGLDAPPPAPSADSLPADWRAQAPGLLTALAQAWAKESAWEGMATAGGVTMPASVMASVALDEIVLHGWDLARATGQRYQVDDELAEAVLPIVTPTGDDSARAGMFGPPVDVPEGAPPFDRALGLAGRDPNWSGG